MGGWVVSHLDLVLMDGGAVVKPEPVPSSDRGGEKKGCGPEDRKKKIRGKEKNECERVNATPRLSSNVNGWRNGRRPRPLAGPSIYLIRDMFYMFFLKPDKAGAIIVQREGQQRAEREKDGGPSHPRGRYQFVSFLLLASPEPRVAPGPSRRLACMNS